MDRIPEGLRNLPQWVCAGADKMPIDPKTGRAASPTNPATWGTYAQARAGGHLYVGFVLTEADPYAIIDLDDKEHKPVTEEEKQRHYKIIDYFQSYTERSVSGRGFHIVIEGVLPAGLRRGAVEAYSDKRYMLCTGDVFLDLPVAARQEQLNFLAQQMMGLTGNSDVRSVPELQEHDGLMDDMDLLQMAMDAANGEKFNQLCTGDWSGMGYPSQSEADYALLSMLAFYSPDNEQVRRLFRMSGLGQREKAVKDNRYLDTCLRKIRAKTDHERIDLTALLAKAPPIPEPQPAPSTPQAAPAPAPVLPPPPAPARVPMRAPGAPFACGLPLPPGLVGEMAQYFLSTVVRPVPEIALVSALGLMAGVTGRCYNISGTGLNQYLVFVAKTGIGKEGIPKGIDRLLGHIRPSLPMVDEFIGPAGFASGQALIKMLDRQPSFVSIMAEFGYLLQQLNDPRAPAPTIMLQRALLDLYTKSGWNDVMRPTAYSDSEKNTKLVRAPSVTLLGETTPDNFYGALDGRLIASGFLPRFSIIEFKGERPDRNRDAGVPPTPDLVRKVSDLVQVCLQMMNNASVVNVRMTEVAQHMMDQFDQRCDTYIRSASGDAVAQIWNRAHLKALKLAGLLAVGVDMHDCNVTPECAQWAIDFVTMEAEALCSRFRSGDVGQGESKQENELLRIIADYYKCSFDQVKSYGVTEEIYRARLVPYDYIRRRGINLTSFKESRIGATQQIKACLEALAEGGRVLLVSKQQASENFGTKTTLYSLPY